MFLLWTGIFSFQNVARTTFVSYTSYLTRAPIDESSCGLALLQHDVPTVRGLRAREELPHRETRLPPGFRAARDLQEPRNTVGVRKHGTGHKQPC